MAHAVLGLRVMRVEVDPEGRSGRVRHEPSSDPGHALLLLGAGVGAERIGLQQVARGWQGDAEDVRRVLSPVSGPPPERREKSGSGGGRPAFRSFEALDAWRRTHEGANPREVLDRAAREAEPFLRARWQAVEALARWTHAFGHATGREVEEICEACLPGFLLCTRSTRRGALSGGVVREALRGLPAIQAIQDGPAAAVRG